MPQGNANVYLLRQPSDVSAETIAELEALLTEAKTGHLKGVAYVALHANFGTHASYNITGACRLLPAVTLGFLHALMKMAEQIL